MPSALKYESRAKCRQNVAPAIVNPEPKMMWEVPRNIV
jgi:hypothetical protein